MEPNLLAICAIHHSGVSTDHAGNLAPAHSIAL